MKTPRTPEQIRQQRATARLREVTELRHGMKNNQRRQQRFASGVENRWLNRHIATATSTDHDHVQGFHYEDPAIGRLKNDKRMAFDQIPMSNKTPKPKAVAAVNRVFAQLAGAA